MRFRARIIAALTALALVAPAAQAQGQLEGRWQGMVKSPLGERQASVTIRKQGDAYTGSLSGLTGTTELPFKEIKVDGDKVTAKMQMDMPQGSVVVDFDFVLKGDTLSGKGDLNMGANRLAFTYEMKRIGDVVDKTEPAPLEKLDYFTGEWKFDLTSRESPFTPGGALAGTMKFTRVLDSKMLEARAEAKGDSGTFRSVGYVGFDAASKLYTFFEQTGLSAILSTGTWTGPGIRLESAPVDIQGKSYRLRRAISIVSDTTFTVKNEFSVDGAPFERLSNGTFTKASAQAAGEAKAPAR